MATTREETELLVAWDTCSFIDYIREYPDEIEALKEIVAIGVKKGKPTIVMSTMVVVETFEGDGYQKIRDHMLNEHFSIRAVGRFVAKTAQDIRLRNPIATRDAVHVATALHYKIPYLITRDGDGKGVPGKRQKDKPLLPLDGKLSLPGQAPLRIVTARDWRADWSKQGHLNFTPGAASTAPVQPS